MKPRPPGFTLCACRLLDGQEDDPSVFRTPFLGLVGGDGVGHAEALGGEPVSRDALALEELQ